MFSIREPYVSVAGNIGFAVGKPRKRTRKIARICREFSI
jgi:hypothetical protein